ncbi:MAG TPA: hypothetical protein VI451_02365 [Anaerolineales bacterium]|nr:hypothetical protein [Anaerolineales bacterium]
MFRLPYVIPPPNLTPEPLTCQQLLQTPVRVAAHSGVHLFIAGEGDCEGDGGR